MKLLVTGGAGFIGSNFIRYWLAKYPDDDVINFDLLTYAGNPENLVDIAAAYPSRYTFVQGDIADAVAVRTVAAKADLIVNFAAETHVDRSIKDSTAFVRTNVLGTQVLLEAARTVRSESIRFHHISTDEVFGSLGLSDIPFKENTPYDPRSPYSASKAASDHLVRSYFHTYDLPVTISNCSNNYGPYQYPEKLIPLFITNLLEGKKVPLYGDGANIRDWIHVDDHNRGIDAIIKKGKVGETYCLGGNSEKTNLEITKLVLNLMEKGTKDIEYVTDRPGHDLRYAIDYTKAKTELDWEPVIDFKTGLKQTIAWYKNNETWWKKLK